MDHSTVHFSPPMIPQALPQVVSDRASHGGELSGVNRVLRERGRLARRPTRPEVEPLAGPSGRQSRPAGGASGAPHTKPDGQYTPPPERGPHPVTWLLPGATADCPLRPELPGRDEREREREVRRERGREGEREGGREGESESERVREGERKREREVGRERGREGKREKERGRKRQGEREGDREGEREREGEEGRERGNALNKPSAA